jgi:hypothetical protein
MITNFLPHDFQFKGLSFAIFCYDCVTEVSTTKTLYILPVLKRPYK